MNDDRISELYKGEIWTDDLQGRARRRIHWLCSQVTGDRVLDVGCSQGIASIVLAREGFSVVGVDIQESRIEYARGDLVNEDQGVRDLVDFQVANASNLPFPEDSFDSAIVGEVVEHLTNPDRVLREIKRVVKPGGAIALTTPFGLSLHHDHKQTFYPRSLLETLSEVLVVESIVVVDRYFRVVCSSTEPSHEQVESFRAKAFSKFDPVWAELDSSLLEARQTAARLEKEKAAASDRHARDLAASVASREVAIVERDTKAVALAKAEQQLADARSELDRTRKELSESSAAVIRARQEVKQAADARAKRDWGTIEATRSAAQEREHSLRKRISRLERDRWKLQNRLAVARWKLASGRERKWARMGRAIGALRRRPWRILVLPFDLVSILFSRSELPKRPQPLPEPKRWQPTPQAAGSSGSASLQQPEAPEPEPTVPRLYPLVVSAPQSMSLAAPQRPRIEDLRVAAILDVMSHDCFAPECHLITFTPNNWLDVLEAQQPHLLLVESAWQGNEGSWQYKVGSYSYPESIGLPDLAGLVDWCRARSIPTVFWNKEDPVHFEKFKEAASIFDIVLSTDSNMLDRYRALPGNTDRVVDVLPFAAQLAIHNPIGSIQNRDPRPVFAGAFYRNRHPERREQLERLLDGAMGHGLVIYDRMKGEVTDSFGFPERFRSQIAGSVPYREMANLYRQYAVFLNANSVVDSPTMFSRRVFELLASGTPVVSTPSVGVESMFPGIVDIVTTADEAEAAIGALLSNSAEWRRRSALGVDSVAQHHTYRDRLEQILRLASIDVEGSGAAVSRISRADLADVTSPEGEWIADSDSELSPADLEKLWVGVRLAKAEIVGFAPSWELAHTYGTGLPPGPRLLAADHVRRYGLPEDVALAGTRIYLVPPRDDR